jgi:hypothetical protein
VIGIGLLVGSAWAARGLLVGSAWAAPGLVAGSARAASQPTPVAPPACALGRLSATNARLVRTVLADERARFERSLSGVSRRRANAAGAMFVTDLAAWLYGFPTVIVRRTILTFPRNAMVSIAKLADTSTQTVVAPNHDTLYSVGQIDLSAGPIVIQTPPTAGRYSVIQLTDGFTNAAAYVGDGAAARTGERVVLVPPGWHGSVPAGLRVVRPETKLLWLLGRTLAAGAADQAAAVALLSHYSVTSLADYVAGTRTAPLVLADFPKGRKPVTVPASAAFFDELGRDLATDPPPARDACAIRTFATVGIGAGKTPSIALRGLAAKALSAAARGGQRVLGTLVSAVRHEPSLLTNGWATTPPDTARFGTDYLGRVVVAAIGLGANTAEKALYITTDRDSTRRPLSGRYVYKLRFKAGQLPPVRQFWSLTLYDRRILFYPNSLNRYAIGDRTAGLKRDAHGGLTIIVSHNDPGRAQRANWLPAPAGGFSLYLRLYEPRPAARHGTWKPPSVVRIR